MPSDSDITKAIWAALRADERTAGLSNLHIRTIDGVVFLDGDTHTEAQLDVVEELARKPEGVRFVQNRLQVSPGDKPGGWRDRERHPGPG